MSNRSRSRGKGKDEKEAMIEPPGQAAAALEGVVLPSSGPSSAVDVHQPAGDNLVRTDWRPPQPDPGQRTERAEIYNQAVNAALLINGGAAVALMTFLQVLWDKKSPLVRPVLYGILLFGAGVLCSACVNLARYYASLHHQRGRKRQFEYARLLTNIFHFGSLIAFVLGLVIMAVGTLRSL